MPAARARLSGSPPPGHVRRLDLGGIRQVIQVDAAPIGQNSRSTPATYSGAFDQIRRVFAETAYARRRRWKPGHFSFNTREGQCPTCLGLGHIDLDVQYLPDITVGCPACLGARFNDATLAVRVDGLTIADVLGLSVHDAVAQFADRALVAAALRPVSEVGLGYLRLGEPTPSLPAASHSGFGSPPGCAPASAVRCTCSTSRPPACIRSTWPRWPACSTGCWRPGPQSSSSTTTWTCSPRRPPHRHGPRRRPGRRSHPRGGDARGRRAGPGQRDRAVAG